MFIKDILRWHPFYETAGDGTGGGGNDTLDDIALLESDEDSDDDDKTNDEDEEVEEDKEEEPEEKEKKPEKKKEEKENEEEEEESTEDENDDDKEKEEEDEPREFSIKALKNDFPELFKKYPEVKDIVYRERAYTQIFGTVEDAEEAAEKVQVFDTIANDIGSGSSKELLDSLEEKQLEKFANNFLPTLQAKNKDLFFAITDKVIAKVLNLANDYATENKDNNLATAIKYVSRFAFGKTEVPDFNERVKPKDPEREEWEKQRAKEQHDKFIEHESSVHTSADEKLTKIITEGMESDDSMSSFVRSAIIDKIKAEVGNQIEKDKPFQAQMTSLWRRAQRENFSKEAKSRIISAYLARARRIIPNVRAKVSSEVAKPNNTNNQSKKRQLNSSTSGGNTSRKISSDPKKINWREVSDEDILSGD